MLSETEWGIALREAVPTAAARALAFDTWVGQVDHDHPSNIAWGINPENESDNALLFFDFELAFGTGGWLPVTRPPFPKELSALVDKEELERVIHDIELFSDDQLHALLTRIPDDFLAPEDKTDMLNQLLTRRGLVRGALGV